MRFLIPTLVLALGLVLCACPPEEDTATLDTTDEAVAEDGHDHAAHGDAKAEGPWAVLHSDAVNRTAENLDNGVKMIFTSDCPHHQEQIGIAVAAKIEHMNARAEGEEGEEGKEHGNCPLHAEGVTITSEAVDKGTAMLFTTEDAELVPQLQEAALKKLAGEGCGCGGHGKHAGEGGHEGHGDKPCAGHAEGGGEDCAGRKDGEDCDCDGDKAEEPAAAE